MVATLANSIVAPCPACELKMSAEAQPAVDIAALTAGMAKGDEDAYRMFHELYFHRFLRYLLVVMGGREEAAREALQLSLLRVVRHIRKFDSEEALDRKSTRLNSSHVKISYAVFCLKKKRNNK